jgi:hypothetical protein
VVVNAQHVLKFTTGADADNQAWVTEINVSHAQQA